MVQKLKLNEMKSGAYPTKQPLFVSAVPLQIGGAFSHQFIESSRGALPGTGVLHQIAEVGDYCGR